MPAAKVTISELDLSVRVPQFPGVYGGIAFPAKKGPVNTPFLVTNETQFLSMFTPDSSVEVGYDLGYFSALAFLQKSDKLWVSRAIKDGLFAGASFKTAAAVTSNQALPAGLSDPTAYLFDSNPDVVALAEKTTITNSNVGAFFDVIGAAKYFKINSAGPVASHYFYFLVTDGVNAPQTDPTPGGTGHAVNILLADTAAVIAGKLQVAIAALSSLFLATVSTNTVTVTNVTAGAVADATADTSGLTVAFLVQGIDAVNLVDELMMIYAWNEGAWGNGVQVSIITDPVVVKEPGAFIINVYKSSNLVVPVESYVCSRVVGAKDGYGRNIYVEDVVQASNYILVMDNTAVDSSIMPKAQVSPLALFGGDDGLAVTDAEMITALDQFANTDQIVMTVMMDAGRATPAFQQEMDSLCQSRKDCIALLSVPFSNEASVTYIDDIINYRKVDLNLNSSYSALYTPHVLAFDKFNNRRLYISPEGYAAAAVSASASNYEIWFPPAGFTRGIINVLDLRRRFTSGEMDALYDAGINPLRFVPGKGIAIWGQKTLLARPSALDRLNVRLLLITIEPAIKLALEQFLFEVNDVATRSLCYNLIDGYMVGIQARRGVTSYRVVCDSTNNTPTDIDNYKMNVDLFIAPIRSVEEIPFRVIITATGVSFESLGV